MQESVAGEYDLPYRPHLTVVLESTISVVFAILSIFGNTLIIAAFCKHKALRTIPNMLVVNLSIVDILSAITTHPLLASVLIQGAWRLGHEACQYQAILNSFLFTASHLSISLITFNRYIVTVHYKKYPRIFTKRTTFIFAVAIWICSTPLGLSHLLAQNKMKFHAKEAICVILRNNSSITSVLTVVFGNAVFLATVFFNFAIFKLVRLHRRQVFASFNKNNFPATAGRFEAQRNVWKSNATGKRARIANRNEELYMARKVLIATSLYTLCWLPQGMLKNASLANVDFSRAICMTSTFCMQLSSVLNPVLYGFLNRKLRKTIIGMLGIKNNKLIHIAATNEATARRLNFKRSFTVTQVQDQGMLTEATLRLE